jgi:hypothetical protein
MSRHRSALATLFIALFATTVGSASAQPNCTFPSKIVDPGGAELRLIGAGIRTYLFRKINAVGLYATSIASDWDGLARQDGPVVARVVFFVGFTKEQLQASWTERFVVIGDKASRERVEPDVRQLMELFAAVQPGDVLAFAALPTGLQLSHNGRTLGVAGDAAFGRLTLSSWFGDKPASDELKASVFAGRVDIKIPCPR